MKSLARIAAILLVAGCSSGVPSDGRQGAAAGSPPGKAGADAGPAPARSGAKRTAGPAASAPAPAGGLVVGAAREGVLLHDARDDAFARVRVASEAASTEQYAPIEENPFLRSSTDPLSTFSVDVDTASWAVVRRHLAEGRLPPAGAVRIEEMINYFPYAYAPPTAADAPFAVHLAAAACPWNPRHRLVRVALKGREVAEAERPPANLVFLVDVSGSMMPANKLPLLREGLALLAARLRPQDRVALAVYAGSSGLVLPSTEGSRKEEILAALGRLTAGGSTNGGAGIRLAYRTAREAFVPGGVNRVVLATDGDFNVGTTSNDELVSLIKEEAKSGVFLTVLGVGTGNYKDDRLEALANKGNGNYAYLDSVNEARKVLVAEAGGTLHCIARDVKIQVEFNPAVVAGYRLLGYENRMLRAQDFADDRKDAGEIGSGHTVTALYEVVPAGVEVPAPPEPERRYAAPAPPSAAAADGELLTVRLRWKEPEGDAPSRLAEFPLRDGGGALADADPEFRFAAAVACFGMVLRGSEHRAGAGADTVLELAQGALGEDRDGWRHEFVSLVTKARGLVPEVARGGR